MQIGCLGDIPFIINSDKVLTPDNLVWSGSARYAEHQRHNYHALVEFTGLDTDKFTLDIKLASELGIDVMDELVKIWTYERTPKSVILILGDKTYGKYRWVIKSHRIRMRYFDPVGNLTAADVNLNLVEYLPE